MTAKCDTKYAIESVATRSKFLGIQVVTVLKCKALFDSETPKGFEENVEGLRVAWAGNFVGSGFNKALGLARFLRHRGWEDYEVCGSPCLTRSTSCLWMTVPTTCSR